MKRKQFFQLFHLALILIEMTEAGKLCDFAAKFPCKGSHCLPSPCTSKTMQETEEPITAVPTELIGKTMQETEEPITAVPTKLIGPLMYTCPPNMIYGNCTCEATCEDPKGESACNSTCLTSKGCICKAGFMLNGSDCINAIECGCFVTDVNLVIPVFQRRTDGSTSFYQNWTAYKDGFGDSRNLWLGNEKLHYLTNQRNYKLRFDITTSGGRAEYAEYTEFQVDSKSSNYTMNKLGAHNGSGNTGYNLIYNKGNQFSTHDRDNDACARFNCAELHRSGWWHNDYACSLCVGNEGYCWYFQYSSSYHSVCTGENLNGVYNGGNGEMIYSSTFIGSYCNVQYVEMKIRPSS
ncbi:uncharacterized protein [Apostichopus japonicus]|uniref:uncharacterized protein isoform X1 n=1 Tax=Stichopus japonicus TaxID=307972 RepID=UPI003AB88361